MKRSLSTSLQNVFETAWPSHIPQQCPKCSCQMRREVNLFIGLSKGAMQLKRLAPWTSLLILAVVVIFMIFAPAVTVGNLGQGSPMALVAMIVGPPILITILANCMGKKYKIQCHQCGQQTDYAQK